ncbi:Predicted transcriptional regulator [Natronorubrum thiooxidans]|uniref:Predicted transcriptional regulator n=2 Tax=Natronorubrum thiooxidans TaxID=308853 RepID=A0A1N7GM97_9EURY|nr:Predicted transcriptional regulator [Natronorubrum thiooxidans]
MTRELDDDHGGRNLSHSVFACESCDTVILSRNDHADRLRCCDESLSEVATPDVATPTLETVSSEMFGLPKRGFDVSLRTSEIGAATVAQVADVLGNDRSVVTRYLNQLVDVGVLMKTRRVRKQGGDVNVYYPIPPTKMRRETILGCYAWAGMAADLLDEMNREHATLEAHSEHGTEKLAVMFW